MTVKDPLKGKIKLFRLAMLSCAFVVSIRNIPTIAESGMHMFFFGIIAVIFFFLPTALVSTELATGWPKEGGIFVWVKEAFGTDWGFWATWLQWATMIVNVNTMLFFVAASFAYVLAPELAENRLYLIITLLIILWGSTFTCLKGLRANSLISTICFIGGVLLPGTIIIVLGIIYLLMGKPIHLDLSLTAKNIIPNFKDISSLVLLVGFSLSFNGIEASASHAGKVVNPKRSYPLAILTVVILGLTLNIIGGLSVACVVPHEKISLVGGLMEGFTQFFGQFNIQWLVPYLGILVAGGALGGANAWLLGPVKGLLETARNGDLPPFFRKTNKNGIPARLLIMQGAIISSLAIILMFSPSINIAFWIAVALSMMINVTMYGMMLLSGIYLRYKHPHVNRTFKIPGKKNIGTWTVSILGLLMLITIFFLGFIPPAELPSKDNTIFYFVIIGGLILVFGMPFIIELFKKPNWVAPSKEDID